MNTKELAQKLVCFISTEDAVDCALNYLYSEECESIENLPTEIEKLGEPVLSLLIKIYITIDLILAYNSEILKKHLIDHFFFLSSVPKERVSKETQKLITEILEMYGGLLYCFKNVSTKIH